MSSVVQHKAAGLVVGQKAGSDSTGSSGYSELNSSLQGEPIQLQLERVRPPLPVFLGAAETVQAAPLGALQLSGDPGDHADQVKAVAKGGFQGSGGGLPFHSQIQRSFGGHDLSNVKAFVGGPAAEASQAMGARAYASGNNVAFRSTPDLHTAAHEATHVVQQRSGVSIDHGVGRPGDAYEKHADAVADAVVSGRNAEPLLSQVAGPATAVQRAVQMDAPEAHTTPDPNMQGLHDRRLAFEDKLCEYGHGAAESNAAMQAMCDKAWEWMSAHAESYKGTLAEAENSLEKIVTALGLPLNDNPLAFSGRVGKDFDAIQAVFMNGNLRERVFHLTNFIDRCFGNDVLTTTSAQLQAILDHISAADEVKEGILDRREEVFAEHGIAVGPDGKPLARVSKTKWVAVKASNEVMRRKNGEFWVDAAGNAQHLPTDSKLPPIAVNGLDDPHLVALAKVNSINTESLVNLNTGGKGELMTVPGIGNARSDHIIEYRNGGGTFAKVDDIVNVPQIGPATLAEARPYLYTEATVRDALIARLAEKGTTQTSGGETDPRTWSTTTLAAQGVTDPVQRDQLSTEDINMLSSREAGAISPLGDNLIPVIRGDLANVLNTSHPWIQMAQEAAMPLRSGPSGTSERFVVTNELLGTGVPASHVRLAMLGFFPRAGGHSYHEIMTATAGHGDCSYAAGVYIPIPPVPDDKVHEMARAAGCGPGGANELSSEFQFLPPTT